MADAPPAEVPPPEGGEAPPEPEPVELPPACMDLTDFPPKIDFFDNMLVLDEKAEKVEGANNLRQVNGFPVFGTGQTTEEGFLKVLDKVKAVHGETDEKMLWFNMRKEPVVYINGNPFAPRNPEDLHRNLDIEFSVEELDNLEAHYTNILKAKAEEKEGVLRTMKDVAFAENPMDREAVGEDTKVENLKGQFEIFNSLRENGFENLVTHRIPVTEERSAGEASFDMMVEGLKNEPASTPCVFSDQMGRGRTTSGMVVACLIKEIQITTELRFVSS